MALVYDGPVQVYRVAGMGPYDNNGYVLADPASKECYLVDAPAQFERLLKEAEGYSIKGVLLTHTHPDHIAGYADLKRLTNLPVAVHADDAARLPEPPAYYLAHNDTIQLGQRAIRVLHTPGHTPGGVCLAMEGCLISGDTLFPGGPGRTRSADGFRQVVKSITELLHVLDDSMVVYPGHGAETTIGVSKAEYAAFAARLHPSELQGDVRWLSS
jgi:glyoxylase-like metal-dependent hydrolase (beta-lactamase superfamily II)